jgi:hypothetical protein
MDATSGTTRGSGGAVEDLPVRTALRLPSPAPSPVPSVHSQHSSVSKGAGGVTSATYTRTEHQHEMDLPHATKKTMVDHLRKYESLFTLTPQRMRMIVEAFTEALEKGLKEYNQVVVSQLLHATAGDVWDLTYIHSKWCRPSCSVGQQEKKEATISLSISVRCFFFSDIRSSSPFR